MRLTSDAISCLRLIDRRRYEHFSGGVPPLESTTRAEALLQSPTTVDLREVEGDFSGRRRTRAKRLIWGERLHFFIRLWGPMVQIFRTPTLWHSGYISQKS
jgi:hypothetical protein